MFSEDFIVIPYLSYSNYVKLPPSVLHKLTNKNSDSDSDFDGISDTDDISFPIYFELQTSIGLVMSVGVMEFTAEEDYIEIPEWICEYLSSGTVKIKQIKNILKCDFLKIQPLNERFYNLPDNDILLEIELSKYCLLENQQIIYINLYDEIYTFKISEIKSMGINCEIVDITNIDVNVDIDNPFHEIKPKKKVARVEYDEDISGSSIIDNIKSPKKVACVKHDEETVSDSIDDDKPLVVGGSVSSNIRESRLAYYNNKFK